jgi:predicted transcriptional regulator
LTGFVKSAIEAAVNTIACSHCKGTGRQLSPVAVGKAMRVLRKRCNKTIIEVAEAMKVDNAYISLLENGKRQWNADLIRRFRDACTE